MKKTILLILAVLLCAAFLFGCSDGKKEQAAASKEHTSSKLYYYEKDNVPFDDDNDCYKFCFLTPYFAENPTGGGVIVFPGGAYQYLSNSTGGVPDYGQGVNNKGDQKEASAIAKWYNEAGISVFVANYRTKAVDKGISYRQILSDALRAVRYLKFHAEQFQLDPDKIAVQGYSAGGHLASMVLTAYDFDEWDPAYQKDEVDAIDAKPAAAVLCYSVLSFREDITNLLTRTNFTGDDAALFDRFSPEQLVKETTSPCFLWCHRNDATVNAANTENFAKALDNCGVKNELHIFDDNGVTDHGVGVAQNYEEAKHWPEYATAFLKDLGF